MSDSDSESNAHRDFSVLSGTWGKISKGKVKCQVCKCKKEKKGLQFYNTHCCDYSVEVCFECIDDMPGSGKVKSYSY
jgi:hypothetical protein